MKIHSQIFLQFIQEIVILKEQEQPLNDDLGILLNTMMTDHGYLNQYTQVINNSQF